MLQWLSYLTCLARLITFFLLIFFCIAGKLSTKIDVYGFLYIQTSSLYGNTKVSIDTKPNKTSTYVGIQLDYTNLIEYPHVEDKGLLGI